LHAAIESTVDPYSYLGKLGVEVGNRVEDIRMRACNLIQPFLHALVLTKPTSRGTKMFNNAAKQT
jgi:hypothetical protein